MAESIKFQHFSVRFARPSGPGPILAPTRHSRNDRESRETPRFEPPTDIQTVRESALIPPVGIQQGNIQSYVGCDTGLVLNLTHIGVEGRYCDEIWA